MRAKANSGMPKPPDPSAAVSHGGKRQRSVTPSLSGAVRAGAAPAFDIKAARAQALQASHDACIATAQSFMKGQELLTYMEKKCSELAAALSELDDA